MKIRIERISLPAGSIKRLADVNDKVCKEDTAAEVYDK